MARLTLILLVVCLVSAGALSQTYESTKGIIARNRAESEAQARLAVLPGAVRMEADEAHALRSDGVDLPVFQGLDAAGGEVGWAVKMAVSGFSGDVVVMVGLRRDDRGELTVAGTRVLRHTETPGLGAEMNAVAYEDGVRDGERAVPLFQKQFVGRRVSELILKKDDAAAGSLDAMTAATISSRAFTKAVRQGMELLGARLTGGATR